MTTDYRATRRYRERHPERRRQTDAKAREAQRELRSRYPDEYAEILASLTLPPSTRYRRAFAILRENHADEWEQMIGR